MKRFLQIVYESIMILLALLSVILFWYTGGKTLVLVIWGVFLIDVLVRIKMSNKKFMYILKNPFDIISIIPFDEFMLLARFSRLILLFRVKTILSRYVSFFNKFLHNMNIMKLSFISFVFIFFSVIILYYMKDWDMLFTVKWVFLNFIKFNYEKGLNDIRVLIIAIILKILGILYIGSLLSKVLFHLKKYSSMRNK